MLNKLYKLFESSSKRIPLEDFTTEVFAGLLQNDDLIRNAFCKTMLSLKGTEFEVSTQKRYSLQDDKDSIVDIVIKSKEMICFIENKVNSHEGDHQLERYAKVLDNFEKDDIKTKLVYCTKFTDPKKIDSHEFQQIKWFEIANLIRSNKSSILSNLVYDYLQQNGMDGDITFEEKDIITMRNFNDTLYKMNQYLEEFVKELKNVFGEITDCRKGRRFYDEIIKHKRYCIRVENVLKLDYYSEVLIGFELRGNLNAHLYLEKTNPYYEKVVEVCKEREDFKIEKYEYGLSVYRHMPILELNIEKSDAEIIEWFRTSIYLLKQIRDEIIEDGTNC
jgi:hypothetical protein